MKTKKIILAGFLSLLLAGVGCSSASTPKEEYDYSKALEPDQEENEQIETEQKEVSSPQETKNQEKKLIYTRKEYILNFSYPENYELKEESAPGNETIKIVKKQTGKEAGEINIRLLDADQWEEEKYNEVNNEEPIFAFTAMADNSGVKWSFYYLSNYQGHLFTIGCLPEDCPWILGGIQFDENLGKLDKNFMAGDWKVNKNDDYEDISLFSDGRFYNFKEGLPVDSGTWEFDKNILKLKSEAGKEFDHTFTNISIGEGGNWIILYEGDETYTWTVSAKPRSIYGIGENVIKDVAFFHGLWQDLGKNSDLKDYNSTSYDPPRFVKIDGEGFYEEYRGKNREIEYGTGEWEFVEGYFLFYPPNEGPTDPIGYKPREKQGLLFLYNPETGEPEVWKKV